MIRILIADDHLVVRDGLRTMLEIQPDVVLMDLRMPRLDGLGAFRAIRRTHPAMAVVILTTYDDDAYIWQGLRAGARGYLLKDASREAILGAIRAAARGETLLTPEVLAKLMARLDHPAAAPEAASATASGEPLLSTRESEVLRLVAGGHRSKEIASSLYITERTVKAHLTSIFTKLGATSRAEAIARAMAAGLPSGPSR